MNEARRSPLRHCPGLDELTANSDYSKGPWRKDDLGSPPPPGQREWATPACGPSGATPVGRTPAAPGSAAVDPPALRAIRVVGGRRWPPPGSARLHPLSR